MIRPTRCCPHLVGHFLLFLLVFLIAAMLVRVGHAHETHSCINSSFYLVPLLTGLGLQGWAQCGDNVVTMSYKGGDNGGVRGKTNRRLPSA